MIYLVLIAYGVALLYLLHQDKLGSALICKLVEDNIKVQKLLKIQTKEIELVRKLWDKEKQYEH